MTTLNPHDYEELIEAAHSALELGLGAEDASIILADINGIDDMAERIQFIEDVLTDLSAQDTTALDMRDHYKYRPVPIREFICNPYYLNKSEEIYPIVLDEVEEMNSGKYVEIVLTGGIGSGKSLAIDTPIATNIGWKVMGDLVEGDVVYDSSGKFCNVTKAHPIVEGNLCYKITFSDGSHIVADKDHWWRTWTESQRANKTNSSMVTTEDIFNTQNKRHSIVVAKPLQGTEILRFGVDLYTLGIWLGDGSSDSGNVWVSQLDQDILNEIGRNYSLTTQKRPAGTMEPTTVHGLQKSLRRLGLLGNKHIPKELLRASVEQRLALLQGLMDSDGAVDKRTGRCLFTNTNKQLAYDLAELVRSLGWKATVIERDAKLYGAFVSLAWVVGWSAGKDFPVFRLARKLKYQGILSGKKAGGPHKWHTIKKVEKINSVPVRCISVDSPSRLYLAGTGMVATHNTTAALYTNAYQLYLLSCLFNPHKLYGLDSASEILLVFQSITARLAEGVDYRRFKQMLEHSPYFRDNFPYDRNLTSRLVFPNRIEVVPLSGSDTAAIGQNVMGGLIDELNYMAIVEKSKQNVDKGTYDQAVSVYNAISRRRKSRFMKQGKVPGILCLVSSKKYPGQFTDTKEHEAKQEFLRTGKTSIYVYDKRVWEIAPDRFAGGTWFNMFIGDESRKPRILEKEYVVPDKDKHLVMAIPEAYRTEFERDPMNSLRDIAGVSTLALFPFFQDRETVAAMFDHHESILSDSETNFTSPPLKILPKNFWRKELPRWIHIDLSLRKDATGISCGCVPGFAAISRGEDESEIMPQIRLDFQLQVKAPAGGEILYHKIRSLIYALRDQGLNVKWISYDSFQSFDSQQILRQNGFVTGEVSMDKSTLPYEVLKTACYDGRITAPLNKLCEKEIVGLEMDPKMKKIDHPIMGSKDVSDSMAGVVYGLTMRREIWTMFDVPVVKMPGSLQELLDKERDRMKAEGDYSKLMG